MNKPQSLAKEKKMLAAMVKMYCRGHHTAGKDQLCGDCQGLLEYAMERLDKCPFGPAKGPCSKCEVHCYKPSMREQIGEVMRYSGPRMLTKNPLLAISHLLKKWKAD